MKWKNPLDTFIIYDTPDGEGLVNSAAFSGDYNSVKYLNTLLVALLDFTMNVNRIAYLKMRCILLETFALGRIQQFRPHFASPFSFLVPFGR
jgi:hypothetical protein